MSLHLTEDFKTVEELQADPKAILGQVQRSGQPVAITMDGKPAAVLLGAAQYEWMLHVLNLSRMLHEAEADVRAGRTRPAEEFFKELESEQPRANKVPRGDQPRRRA